MSLPSTSSNFGKIETGFRQNLLYFIGRPTTLVEVTVETEGTLQMDFNKIVSALGSSGAASGLMGGLAGGALSGALMSKKGRKYAGKALQIGGIAALGGLAWKAYQTYQANQAGSPRDRQSWDGLPEQNFAIPETGDAGSRGFLLVRAMITAALADGHLDSGERHRIVTRIDELGLGGEEKALLAAALLTPPSVDELINEVSDRETAIEVYAASLVAVDESMAARTYLDALAKRLTLPTELTEALEQQIRRQGRQAA